MQSWPRTIWLGMCQYLIRVYFSPSLSFPSPISPSPLASNPRTQRLRLHYSSVNKKVHASPSFRFLFLLRKASVADLGLCSNARSSRSRWAAGGPRPRGALHVSQLSTRLLPALTGERIPAAGSWPLLSFSHGLSVSAGAGVLSARLRLGGGRGQRRRSWVRGILLFFFSIPQVIRWDWLLLLLAYKNLFCFFSDSWCIQLRLEMDFLHS